MGGRVGGHACGCVYAGVCVCVGGGGGGLVLMRVCTTCSRDPWVSFDKFCGAWHVVSVLLATLNPY
jgi:hypothetical protein